MNYNPFWSELQILRLCQGSRQTLVLWENKKELAELQI